jgi:hypothetical protein
MNLVPHVVVANTIVDAWCQCANVLLSDGDRLNLVVHIDDPSEIDLASVRQLDPKTVDVKVMSVFDVASTIFPHQGRKWDLSIDAFSNYYIPVYERLKRRSSPTWGFYFQRLASFGPGKINQIARIVNGLSSWGKNHHAAFVMHVSSSALDKPKPLGAPCWQYGQFMADDGKLELTVVYRSHDYYSKALGNFLGLSRLLTFVCSKTGHEVGSLTCLSTYAFLGQHRTKVKQLLSIP